MSISNDYQNLADRVAGYANRLEPIMPSAAKHIAANLLALADQVQHMERMAIAVDAFVYADKEEADVL